MKAGRYRVATDALRAADTGAESAAGRPHARSTASESRFYRQGGTWTISYGGNEIRLRDSKGLRYIARLLASPGREIAALDLASPGSSPAEAVSVASAATAGLRPDSGGGLEVSDRQSLAEYRERLVELRSDIDEADASGDLEMASRRREELDLLARHITASTGLGGAPRRTNSPSERARQSVTKAIRSALQVLTDEHPALGLHLAHSVRTGRYCTYDPDPAALPTWVLKPSRRLSILTGVT
jgi:hypothetical protein